MNKLHRVNYFHGVDMSKLKVFFADRQTRPDYNMLDKLEHVFDELGLRDSIKSGEKIMIKTHFGLYGNTNYIRPAYVRKLDTRGDEWVYSRNSWSSHCDS